MSLRAVDMTSAIRSVRGRGSRFPAATVVMAMAMAMAVATVSGCGFLRKAATGSLMEDVATATNKHEDPALVAQAAPAYLLMLDGMLEGNPNDTDLLLDATQAYTSYGALLELSDPDRGRLMYSRAKEYGLRALARKRRVGALLTAPYARYVDITKSLRADDVELVFWAASSWGAWISLNIDSMAALAELPRVILLMEWVLERDEAMMFGSPHLFLGVYYAALPPMLGGRPERAREHFDRARELTGGNSGMVYVQMARYYARQIYDRELYVSLLQRALTVPVDAIPELTLQNAAAREMAQKLLEETDAFF